MLELSKPQTKELAVVVALERSGFQHEIDLGGYYHLGDVALELVPTRGEHQPHLPAARAGGFQLEEVIHQRGVVRFLSGLRHQRAGADRVTL